MAKRILYIDDDAEVRSLVERVLLSDGHEVTTAQDGVAGITTALQGKFDLIISDVMMPYIDGYDLCKELRKHAETDTIPVLIVSARESPLVEKTAQLYGATAFLRKPFRIGDLQSTVRKLLGIGPRP